MKREIIRFEQVRLSYEQCVVPCLDFAVSEGEILALAGESGSGKSSILKAILGLLDTGVRVERGRIFFDGVELERMEPRDRRKLLGSEIAMIFQNPGETFNPIRTYRKQFAEMMKSHGIFQGKKSYGQILECFQKLSLPDGERLLDSRPYELSGGMNQRIAIAAALLLKPKLILADEPTSALDAATQKTVVEELLKLQRLTGTSMILVTHDLGIAARMADHIGIIKDGELVEYADTDKVLRHPEHPYTKSLLAAMPVFRIRRTEGQGGWEHKHKNREETYGEA